jgi:hypothetical protein
MNPARLKPLLYLIWGLIVVLGGILAFWTWNSPDAAPLRDFLANRPPSATPTITATPVPTWAPPTLPPTVVIIIPTRRPVSPTPVPPTTTPVTPLPTLPAHPAFAPPGINPLTGLSANPVTLARRPVAVKISNFPRPSVRPVQSGLTLADVVYEYYIEDGLTRFIAIFYGNDAERAGPVRSARYFDEHIMLMYHSSLVYNDADPRVETYLEESNLKPLLFVPRPDNCPPLCDDPSIEGYNDVFVNTAGVGAFLSDNSPQKLRFSAFSPAINIFDGVEKLRVYTVYSIYSYNYWEYDPNSGIYLRYSDAIDATGGQAKYAAHIDQLTGQQLAADNVVALLVPHDFKNDYDREDQVFDIRLTGSGAAYVFREGRMYQASWERDDLNQLIRLLGNDGKPFPLRPGVTYYQVLNQESSVSESGKEITFRFFIPPQILTPMPTATKFKPTSTPRK